MNYVSTDNLYLSIIILFAAGLVVALLIRWFLDLYAKRIADRPNAAFLVVVISAVRHPLYWSVISLSAALSLYLLTIDPTLSSILYDLLSSFVIAIWAISVYLHLQPALQSWAVNFQAKHRRKVTDAIPFIAGLFKAGLLFTAIYFIFLTWGIDLTPLLAALSIIGAALSFAARDSVGNVIAGIGIFMSRPFKVGDYVIIDDKQSGTVVETTLQLTKLKTPEKTIINIPNSLIVTKPLQNYNAINPYYRLVVPFTIPLTADIAAASDLILDAAKQNKWVLKKPLPRVKLLTPTEKSLTLELIVMLDKPAQAKTVTSQLVKATHPPLHQIRKSSE